MNKENLTPAELSAELIVLGTGNALATRCYNTCFVLRQGNDYLLTDAGGGNGIMLQLQRAGISYTDIRQMFVTHGHTDHVLGVVWIVRRIAMLMNSEAYAGDFTIYCHDELVETIRTFCRLTLPGKLMCFMDRRILLREVKDGQRLPVAGMDLEFFDIGSTKKKQFGFHATLADGQRLVCLGDEPCTEAGKKYAQGADWLLSEAFCLFEEREEFHPYEKHHSTAIDAGLVAEELKVKNLVLYHTEDNRLDQRKERYSREARQTFSGTVCVPDDLERIQL
ncbi:MAG: MBL fold metallo-hydrolase [Bacteroides sp.]|nr:MBL fold metallo-hydrolase [Bacteroides sp.]